MRGSLLRAAQGSSGVVLAALFALSTGACDDPLDPGAFDERVGCTADEACPTGLRCQARACVGGAAPLGTYALRIVPGNGDGRAAVELEDLRFTGTPTLVLETPLPVPKAAVLTGTAQTADGLRPATSATARPSRGLTQRPLVISSSAELQSGGFELALAPWWPTLVGGARQITYQVRLEPQDLPPWRIDVLQVESGDQARTLDLPDTANLVTLSGVVVVSEANPSPLRDLEVVALDAEGRTVSTTGRTDTAGAFSVQIWPEDAARELVLRAKAAAEDRPLPVLTQPISVAADGRAAPATLYLGESGPTFNLTGAVRGTNLAGDTVPVPGATVRLRATVGNGAFALSTRTDAEGQYRAVVYPGDYVVDVEPPIDPELPLRLTRRTVTLSAEVSTFDLNPLPRSAVYGQVVDAAGEPVGSASLTAELAEARYGDPRLNQPGEVPPARRVTGLTGPDGTFALTLDPGVHALTVSPPPERGLPVTALSIEVSGEQGRPVDVGTLTVPAAAVVVLEVSDDTGGALNQATVELWRVAEPPVRLATSTSNADGRVVLVMPNPTVNK